MNDNPVVKRLATEDRYMTDIEYRKKLLEEVRVLEQSASVSDPLEGKDPDFAYCWIFNDLKEIQKYQHNHYEVVNKTTDPELTSPYKKENGSHVNGDAILMRASKDRVKALNALRELTALDRIEDSRSEFIQWGAQAGVPVTAGRNHGQDQQ